MDFGTINKNLHKIIIKIVISKNTMEASCMSKNAQKSSPKKLKPQGKDTTYMGAKIANQINTNQQSNMCLSAYSVATQSSSTVNVNLE